MTEVIQIVTTTEGKSDAQTIARALIEKRLAACVQIIGPVLSTYRWKGKIETSDEWLCTIKTRSDLYLQVEESIRALHSYDEPEILATPIVKGSASYIEWLNAEVGGSADEVG